MNKKKKEVDFFVWLRSGLRSLSRKWPPVFQALALAKHPAPPDAPPRQRVAYECAICGNLNPSKNAVVDHIKPAGTLLVAEDIQGFVETLFCGIDNLQVLCKDTCHRYKTASEKLGISFNDAKIECQVIDLLKNKQQALDKLEEYGYTGHQVSNNEKRRALLRHILMKEAKEKY